MFLVRLMQVPILNFPLPISDGKTDSFGVGLDLIMILQNITEQDNSIAHFLNLTQN
jgi:hypothetical protein